MTSVGIPSTRPAACFVTAGYAAGVQFSASDILEAIGRGISSVGVGIYSWKASLLPEI